jgi:hypothetical protein
MSKRMSGDALARRIEEKLARRTEAYADCLARPCAWDAGKWSGAELRAIRARKGVGRPVKAAV